MQENIIHGTTLGVYSLFDTRADVYLDPFYAKTRAEAERIFLNVMFKVDPIRNHCSDYDLRYLGTFDTGTGEFIRTGTGTPTHVVNGLHLFNSYQDKVRSTNDKINNDSSIQSSSEGGDTTQ